MLVGLIICVVIEILLLLAIHRIWTEQKLKQCGGMRLKGKIIKYAEIPGRPNWYLVTVAIDLNGQSVKWKIITTDKAARKYEYEREEQVPVIYIETKKKFFWEEEADSVRRNRIIILSMMAAGMGLIMLFWALCLVLAIGGGI